MPGESNEVLLGRIDERLGRVAEETASIRKCLEGNGSAGLVVRVDRIEQREKGRLMVMRALLAAWLAALAAWLKEMVGR